MAQSFSASMVEYGFFELAGVLYVHVLHYEMHGSVRIMNPSAATKHGIKYVQVTGPWTCARADAEK